MALLRVFPVSPVLIIALVTGCVRVEFLEYRGPQDWPTGSAFVTTVKDSEEIEVYEGLPQQPYEVIGLIDVYDSDPLDDSKEREKIVELVKLHNADALIWLSARAVSSGSLLMGQTHNPSAIIDAGRSTQPTVTVTQASQYTYSSHTKSLRSTLFLIRWETKKPNE